MQIRATSSTTEILHDLGTRLQRFRLQQNITVEDLASASGVSERTINRAEAGDNATLATVVKLLRALGRLDALDTFLPEPLPSPMEMAALGGRPRRRARNSNG